MRLLTLFTLLFCSLSSLPAETLDHRGTTYHILRVDPKKEKIQLTLSGEAGKPNLFTKVQERLEKDGRRLKFAMNAGIFEGTFLPTGLHVSEGETVVPLNLETFKKDRETQLTPNFYLKPNGVFFLRKDGSAGILESQAYADAGESVTLATQSGPLLVWGEKIHPILSPTSKSTRLRNGVGVDSKGNVVFVSSLYKHPEGESNLYHFAELFRDRLDCKQALYLDGDISYIYIRGETGPIEDTNGFAGILAITEPVP